MRSKIRQAAVAGFLIVTLALAVGCPQPQPKQNLTTSATTNGPDIQQIAATLNSSELAKNKATSDLIGFAWVSFIYYNWPALLTARGQRDPQKHFGSPGPVVWQTWKASQDLYVPKGQTPLPWNQGPIYEPPALQSRMIDGKVLTDKNGNPVMYEVRLNQDTFNYILSRNLYSFAGQMQLLNGGQPVSFPEPAVEIKASWRFLGSNDDPTHYLTATVNYNGAVRVVGLSGLHITSRVLPQWVWMTFEQIENPQTTGVSLKLPIAAPVQAANQAMQAKFAGTKWAYYQLDGIQAEFTTGPDAAACIQNLQAPCLANSQIETYFQGSSSCITCHSLASIGPKGARFNFWNYAGGNQQGYMGNPPPMKSYVPLDFVWSMREAH